MEEIVISGISGRFPECDNVEEFMKKLYDGTDMITEDNRRWQPGLFCTPKRMGKLKDLAHFDAQYFNINSRQAKKITPMTKILLETSYEAVVDSGVNPSNLRGSQTGVFVGYCMNDSHALLEKDVEKIDNYDLLVSGSTMLANIISFTFDFKGPSYTIDSACSSSIVALELALKAIKSGKCDAAIVGSCNLLLDPQLTLKFAKLGVLAPDGVLRAFDDDATGFVRSEAIGAIFLQKAEESKRVYAKIAGVKIMNDGYKTNGIFYPSVENQKKLIEETYAEIGINSSDIEYLETHGTGTEVGDVQELNAVAQVHCVNRELPLLIGSVKSNMGHGEGACGICSLIKVVLMMETGIIPGNLNFKKPNSKVAALNNGTLKVIDCNMPYNGGLVAINSFGLGGTNGHVVLRPHLKLKLGISTPKLPRLIIASGRTKEAVEIILTGAEKYSEDDEFLALLDTLHQTNNPGHHFRGYKILSNESNVVSIKIDKSLPIWFIYSGMGSQWSKMGRDLMLFDVFKNSIKQYSKIMKPYNINLEYLLTEADMSEMNKLIEVFVTYTAVQLAITDLLFSLNIKPNGILGHSVGEIACGYADGTLTAEQALLVSYFRGRSIAESNLQKGLMAVVCLTPTECLQRCSSKIKIACYNAENIIIVSGPMEEILNFITELQNDGCFARIVNTPEFAFHSTYVADAGKTYKKYLDSVITNPKLRSSKWISSSILECDGGKASWSQQCSSEYYLNNLISPVLFYQALKNIPKDAVIIEISPNSSLQTVLQNSLGVNIAYISLSKKHHPNNELYFLSGIGKLYTTGIQPCIGNLYPPVSFPVGRGTAMLNSLVGWDHSVEWELPKYAQNENENVTKTITFNVSTDKDRFLKGHRICGLTIFPGAGYLFILWKTLTNLNSSNWEETNVVFKDVVFHRPIILPENTNVVISINILQCTGNFEISESNFLVVSGKICVSKHTLKELKCQHLDKSSNASLYKNKDVYKQLKLRGFEYEGSFKGIVEIDTKGCGKLKWNDDWISFLDCLFQTIYIFRHLENLMLIVKVAKLTINPKLHKQFIRNNSEVPVINNKKLKTVRCGGIEVQNATFQMSNFRKNLKVTPKLERYEFIPYEHAWQNHRNEKFVAVNVIAQIVLENTFTLKLKIMEITDKKDVKYLFIPELKTVLDEEITMPVEYTVITDTICEDLEELKINEISVKFAEENIDFNLIVVTKETLLEDNIKASLNYLEKDGFLLLEKSKINFQLTESFGLEVVAIQVIKSIVYVLLRKILEISDGVVIKVSQDNFSWMRPLKSAIDENVTTRNRIYLVSQNETYNGLIGFMNCILKEPESQNIRAFFIQDNDVENFSLTSNFYKNQIKKDLVHNVLKNGVWGSFRHIKLPDEKYLQVQNAYIDIVRKGNLSSLTWIENSLLNETSQNFYEVYYAPVNFKDVMEALGNIPNDALPKSSNISDTLLGIEFSGRDSTGKRVMGMLSRKGLATKIEENLEFVWDIPDTWSMEDAATVSVSYATSYYSLIMRGNLQPGETVLIHNGAGGVGLAAITIALHMKCIVFTTIGSNFKRDFLKNMFPTLEDEHIECSRDANFRQTILELTNGEGVDVVLNTLSDELFEESLLCLKSNGRFLELGKTDMVNNTSLNTNIFLKNTSFHGIMLDELLNTKDTREIQKLAALVKAGIDSQVVKPLPRVIFERDEYEQAFRCVAAGKHVGKVILKIKCEESQESIKSEITRPISALGRMYMDPHKSYIIIGGLGGFGLELVDWLIKRGASKIVISSRFGIKDGYQQLCMTRWQKKNVNVLISTSDVTTLQGVETLLNEAKKLGTIGGIFNLAVVLKDGIFQNLSKSDFETVYEPKMLCTRLLDEVSRTVAPNLDYFVVFSSVSCGRGNAGQTNYGLANSAMERICENRHSAGLPGLAIQWGIVGDVGFYMETMANRSKTTIKLEFQPILSCLSVLDQLLRQPYPVVSSMVLKKKNGLSTNVEHESIVNILCNILGIDDKELLPSDITIKNLGVDSLMVAELKQFLERNYKVTFTIKEIHSLTLKELLVITNSNDTAKLNAKD